MTYTYRTHLGTFWIRPGRSGRWTLGIGEEALGSYATAELAADDVYTQHTGYYPWDSLDPVEDPTDLGEWSLFE